MRILTAEFNKVFIVVDALDECAEKNRDTVLELLAHLQISGANILVTSRDHIYDSIAESELVDVQRVDIRGSTEDITLYVKARLLKQKRLARIIRTQPALRDEIITSIVASCDGMFLMATFQLESLGKHINAGKIRDALKVLPNTFPLIYDEAMLRIESNEDHSEEALRVLSFLIHARRPLSLMELQHFLAVTPGDADIREDYITDRDTLISICAGLIVVDDKSGIVRLVHFTAQEYFDGIAASKFPLGDQEMGRACLTYLSFNTFRDIASLSNTLHRYVLLKYIVHFWHMHISNHEVALKTPLSIFFEDHALIRAYSYFMREYHRDYFEDLFFHLSGDIPIHGHGGLHVAAAAGLPLVVSWLIETAIDVNSKDFTGRSPLVYSSEGGHAAVAHILLANGADVSDGRENYGTVLLSASSRGHEETVRLLLQHGADVNALGSRGESALLVASAGCHNTVVKLLLKNGADLNARTELVGYGTAVLDASARGHQAVVKLLLEHGADIKAKGKFHGNSLIAASAGGHVEVVKQLLDNGADVNANIVMYGELENTALLAASAGGHELVVRQLLKAGADVNTPGRSALIAASAGGYGSVVKLLLESGADINTLSQCYKSALDVVMCWLADSRVHTAHSGQG
ncbi:ankyrin repeat-containing domain protein [Crassisporium funariophilum]|nr:ankyrin repeat-containing domain protein [Crassisporium funariophilum]